MTDLPSSDPGLAIHVHWQGQRHPVQGYTIGRQGIFIALENPPAVGERLAFVAERPNEVPLVVHGHVAWKKEGIVLRADRSPGDNHPLRRLSAWLQEKSGVAPTDVYRVLIVDDNPHIIEMLKTGLARFDQTRADLRLDIDVASDGVEAMESLKAVGADLLISDLYMPRMDGTAVLDAIRLSPTLYPIRVLVVSAEGEEARQRAMAAGADAFLEKPVLLKHVVEQVQLLLDLNARATCSSTASGRGGDAIFLCGLIAGDRTTPVDAVGPTARATERSQGANALLEI
jgi:CheY-like chemotaxis protein